MSKLQLTEADLQKREDELRSLEKNLERKKNDLDATRDELKERASRVNELEQMLADKDRAVNELKDKVVSALKGFENKGLSVETKNGKVYVNEKIVKENYPIYSDNSNLHELLVGDGYFFLLGDNRPISQDSRSWGMMSKEQIIGKVWSQTYLMTIMMVV